MEPDILLMDEATSALDPISTSKIEDLIADLKQKYTIVIVTHNMQQATRVSDKCAFSCWASSLSLGTLPSSSPCPGTSAPRITSPGGLVKKEAP